MINLLNAARVPKDDQVEVIKIQLMDVARTWWIAEEERLEKPVSWEKFTENFYEQFFSKDCQEGNGAAIHQSVTGESFNR